MSPTTLTPSAEAALSPPTAPQASDPPRAATEKPETVRRFIIDGVSWKNYRLISDGVGEQPIRVTFDGERIELKAASDPHKFWKTLIAYLLAELCDAVGLDFTTFGNMTMRKESANRGLEADDCFYIRSFPAVEGRIELDLENDPPPDLALEIEITRSVLDRIAIYAALGVPELWRFDGSRLVVMVLGPEGAYRASNASPTFPTLPLDDFATFVRGAAGVSRRVVKRRFQKWLHTSGVIPPGGKEPADL